MTSEIPMQTKHEVLEHRVNFMVVFYVAMDKQGISEPYKCKFRNQDHDFIYRFCELIKVEPEPYIKMYDERIGVRE